MPLRDHFHPPMTLEVNWPSVHHAWAGEIVRRLNTQILPRRYRAQAEVTLGQEVVLDVATWEQDSGPTEVGGSGNGAVATAVWAPPATSRSTEVTFPAQDVFEVRVHDGRRRVVAAVELVSESNKDRPDARSAFAVKCAGLLQQRVSVVVVDVVTSRHSDLYGEVLSLLGGERGQAWPGNPPLYAVALRTTQEGQTWRLDAWEEALALGAALPTLPLWLASDLVVPLELEATYEEACKVLRIA
jgi:hypothetical protein